MANRTGVGRGDGVSPKNADSRLAGKVALVTGASKGIGAGIAREFAAAGASVVVNYASSAADAERVVQDIQARGGPRSPCRATCRCLRMLSASSPGP